MTASLILLQLLIGSCLSAAGERAEGSPAAGWCRFDVDCIQVWRDVCSRGCWLRLHHRQRIHQVRNPSDGMSDTKGVGLRAWKTTSVAFPAQKFQSWRGMALLPQVDFYFVACSVVHSTRYCELLHGAVVYHVIVSMLRNIQPAIIWFRVLFMPV